MKGFNKKRNPEKNTYMVIILFYIIGIINYLYFLLFIPILLYLQHTIVKKRLILLGTFLGNEEK